jgi:hypothetical protein
LFRTSLLYGVFHFADWGTTYPNHRFGSQPSRMNPPPGQPHQTLRFLRARSQNQPPTSMPCRCHIPVKRPRTGTESTMGGGRYHTGSVLPICTGEGQFPYRFGHGVHAPSRAILMTSSSGGGVTSYTGPLGVGGLTHGPPYVMASGGVYTPGGFRRIISEQLHPPTALFLPKGLPSSHSALVVSPRSVDNGSRQALDKALEQLPSILRGGGNSRSPRNWARLSSYHIYQSRLRSLGTH